MNFLKLLSSYKQQLISISVIIGVIVFANTALFADKIYDSDDYLLHAGRTANYYLAIRQGQLPVRWAPNLNHSLGYPSFNYMYHTPYVVGSVFHFFNFSIQQSVNLTVLISLLLAGVGTYFFVRSYKISEVWSVVLSLSAVLNPYTLLLVYWRGAFGELYFYACIPFLLLGIKQLLLKKRSKHWLSYFIGTACITALLILSHLPSMLLLLPVVLLFIFSEINWNAHRVLSKQIFVLLVAAITGIVLSAWYWIPAYFEQWMIVYEDGSSLAKHVGQFVPPQKIFDITRSIFSSEYFLEVISIGIAAFFALVAGVFLIVKKKAIAVWIALAAGAVLLLSTYAQPIWDTSKTLQYVQYPFRMLWIITVVSLLLYIELLQLIQNRVTKSVAFVAVVTGIIFSTLGYAHTKGETSRSDFEWYQTFDTGSSFDEHRPIWSESPYYFPEELAFVYATQSAELNEQTVHELVHPLAELNPTMHRFDGTEIFYIISPDADIIALHKRLFYPGWEAQLGENNLDFLSEVPEYNGILALPLPADSESTVTITFTGYTELRRFAEVLSLVGALGLIFFAVLKYKKEV